MLSAKNSSWLASSVLLLATGFTLVWLVLSENISAYVRPDYHLFTLVMGGICLFLGYSSVVSTARAHAHSHEEMNPHFASLVAVIFAGFSLYLIFFHRSTLSVRAAANRGVNQNAVTGTKSVFSLSQSTSPLLEVSNTAQYNLADWIRLFRINPDAWSHKGKKAQVLGFVQPQEGGFYLARFVVSCCTVDASPVGIFVKTSQRFPEGKWLEVTGVLDTLEFQGKVIPVVVPEKIEEKNEPEQPYLY